MTTTLLQLRNACKQKANMSGSSGPNQAIPDAEWNQDINASIAEFRDVIVSRNVGFYLTSSVFTLTGSSSTYILPDPGTVVRGMDRSLDGTGSPTSWYDVTAGHFNQRNRGHNAAWLSNWYSPYIRYDLRGDTLFFEPATACAGTYQLWYYPSAPVLVNDSDTFDDRRYWYEYVVIDVAIKAKDKEESDVSVLMSQKQGLLARLEEMAANRDYSMPEQIGHGWWGGVDGGGWGY